MSPGAYLRRTLVHHWRTNLAVLLGVAAGTAVLTGALLVGDSVRGSLRQMTLDRLGRVDHVLSGPRFVRQHLVADIEALRHDHDKLKIKIKLNSLETAISSKISDDASAANNRLKILQNRLKKGLTAAIERAQISAEASAAFDRLKHSDLS